MATTTVRISTQNRDRLNLVVEEEGGTLDDLVSRLLDEHWQSRCIAAVRETALRNPSEWADAVSELGQIEHDLPAPSVEPWVGPVVDGQRGAFVPGSGR